MSWYCLLKAYRISVRKRTDIAYFVEMGVAVTPALVVDGQVKVSGKVPSEDVLEQILQQQWIQVLLCDQRMPDMTGIEFLEQIVPLKSHGSVGHLV